MTKGKLVQTLLSYIAALAIVVGKASVGTACMFITYQPKMPECLQQK